MSIRHNPPSVEPGRGPGEALASQVGAQVTHVLWATTAVLALLLIVGLVLLSSQQTGRQAQTVAAGEAQSGSQVDLQVGDTLEITLESNPSTGYRWSQLTLDTSILRPLGEAEFRPAGSLLGASGTETFRFATARAGHATLSFVYSRPFEQDAAPIKTFMLDVRVTKP
jgi:inhibitor of cysteine peptidase